MIQQLSQNQYPSITSWIEDGSIEIGREYGRGIVARAIDEGGVAWEGTKFKNFTEAVNTLEKGIEQWCEENY